MADMNNKQTVQGGAILDALSKLFFKGLDNIFDAAVQYEKEMGVLKQVNNITVKDKAGNEYTVTIKLAPIKDKKDIFFVEVSSDAPNFAVSDDINKKAITISTESMKDFKKMVNDILKANNLTEVKDDDESSEEEQEEESEETEEAEEPEMSKEALDTYRFGPFFFTDIKAEQLEYKVFLNMKGDVDDEKFTLTIESDPKLRFNYMREFAFDDDSPDIVSSLTRFVDKCGIEADSNDFERTIQNIQDKYADYVDDMTDVAASSSIKVTLEKVTADGHDTVNLVDIIASSYTRRDTLARLGEIVASDDFVDSMPEGESTYKITEDNDSYDIDQI